MVNFFLLVFCEMFYELCFFYLEIFLRNFFDVLFPLPFHLES